MIFEMRNTVVVSRGRGGVRVKVMRVDVIESMNYQNLLKLRYI